MGFAVAWDERMVPQMAKRTQNRISLSHSMEIDSALMGIWGASVSDEDANVSYDNGTTDRKAMP